MTDMDDPRLEIEPKLIIRYLQHSGWKVDDFRGKLKRVSYSDPAGGETVEIFFGDQASPEGKKRDVFFALNTISDFYERALELVSSDIRSLTFDLITSKIPNEYVLNRLHPVAGRLALYQRDEVVPGVVRDHRADGRALFQTDQKGSNRLR